MRLARNNTPPVTKTQQIDALDQPVYTAIHGSYASHLRSSTRHMPTLTVINYIYKRHHHHGK